MWHCLSVGDLSDMFLKCHTAILRIVNHQSQICMRLMIKIINTELIVLPPNFLYKSIYRDSGGIILILSYNIPFFR